MVIALGVIVATFLALLVVGGVTGRVKVTSCCAAADPRRDARMRSAYPDLAGSPAPNGESPASCRRQLVGGTEGASAEPREHRPRRGATQQDVWW